MQELWADLAVAIPTFGRNENLLEVLRSIEGQTVVPRLVVVIDNNPGGEARRTV
jgi:GT2 family glycosyltransferase